jgi:hypothetical protein
VRVTGVGSHEKTYLEGDAPSYGRFRHCPEAHGHKGAGHGHRRLVSLRALWLLP